MAAFMEHKEIEDSYHNITILEVLGWKTEVETKEGMPPGLAACFSRAIELLRSDPNAFYDCRLILQGGGQIVTIKPVVFDESRILWYDEHQHVVQDERVAIPWYDQPARGPR